MKLSLLICAIAASSAAAFAPSAATRKSTSLNMSMDRRSALAQVGIAAAGLASIPSIASADGAISSASIGRARGLYGDRIAALKRSADGAISSASMGRARGLYGDRIAALKSAVDSGNFAAVADEKSAFVLFNSGVYPTAKDKSKKAAAIEGTNAIFRAIRAKDSAALKSAYAAYVADNSIEGLPDVSIDGSNPGQGYSSDFDYRVKSKAAAIYVR
eukprot:CAMPEP_0172519404 /NCGR_PEP_ID=MMETSP1066-20121228/291383_1 /TAXON_ID=671091 /ORGANISM="Coscinodiscus wailesii, Strain CCMP2513" /LENGTH=215 /DNA_ID=CAMNT_0013301985 /DNA_START=119 /DNA_END=766 /DNA_ORIENTATION=-